MNNDLINIGPTQAHWSAAGTRILKYSTEIYHTGLNEHKLISAPDIDILKNKVSLQINKWSDKWEIHERKLIAIDNRESSIEEANRRSREAIDLLNNINNILAYTLSIDDTIDWTMLKIFDDYPVPSPSNPIKKDKPIYPSKPYIESLDYHFKITIFDRIFKSKLKKKKDEAMARYSDDMLHWKNDVAEIDKSYFEYERKHEIEINTFTKNVSEWEADKSKFIEDQIKYNQTIDIMKQNYFKCVTESIVEYCEMVLNNSNYPDFMQKNFEIEYNEDNKILIVEYELPRIESYPTIKDVKYVASTKTLRESHISDGQLYKLFDETTYKITLRTIHELFEADSADAIAAVSFNGWIRSINKATGKEENNCILSIQVKKEEFNELDLANVDPKICFRKLKGVASSKLSSLTPIQPIMQISKSDKRFIDSYDVSGKLDNSFNLAAMDWEDFEHLIREIFEKEFKQAGGEVKVTQASRDGGVDAIAFDPDPIRGGKIVIQAKRYTNTVGVSAVRDLYGTVLNEGATKGILVTTADYGADAYEFARGKPLTLMNGSNLLFMLERHGQHAKIDLREAKQILADEGRK